MRIRQYAYFSINSREISARELARRLGMPGDRIVVAGSSSRHPLRPPRHAWQLVCDDGGLTVEEQVSRVVARLRPARASLMELATDSDISLVLQVVRYFNDEDGEEEDMTPAVEGMEKLPGQHQLLGWHLDAELLQFLSDLRAELDFDEYG